MMEAAAVMRTVSITGRGSGGGVNVNAEIGEET